jgi:O-antigen/teichoic acid export membrane protein
MDRPTVSDGTGRHESPEQRDDRNLQDLLQELRVAAIGVQVLFGFLLSIPFTTRFHLLDGAQRDLYLASLLLAALATVLLSGPVAYHRLVFRRHEKERLVQAANVMALAGLTAVGLAITAAIALIATVVVPGAAGTVIVPATAAVFVSVWLVVPLRAAHHAPSRASDVRPGGGV